MSSTVTDFNDNVFRGYSLFKDVADEELRNHNRAAVLRNIVASRGLTPDKKLPTKTAAEVVQYFNRIPPLERKAIYPIFRSLLEADGLATRNSKEA